MKNDSGSKFAFREVANVTTKPAKIPGSSPFHSDRDAIYEDAIFEINPDKLTSCIEEAEQAIAQRESFVDITQAERHRLADARSVLKSLSRIALP